MLLAVWQLIKHCWLVLWESHDLHVATKQLKEWLKDIPDIFLSILDLLSYNEYYWYLILA